MKLYKLTGCTDHLNFKTVRFLIRYGGIRLGTAMKMILK